MRSLIERQGGMATVVPSMREAPLERNVDALGFARSLLAGEIDLVVFLTGVGAQALLSTVESTVGRAAFLAALRRLPVAVRGPKPAAVLREWNVPIAVRAAEPNTWRELVAVLCGWGPLAGKRIAVQEYGRPSEPLYDALRAQQAVVRPVPVYRWVLPDDVEPLKGAIRDTIAGRFDVLLFTSAHQLDNVLEVARAEANETAWLAAARRCVIGSIGPTASETIIESGLPVDVEADPTRMGQLVRAALQNAAQLLAAKRHAPPPAHEPTEPRMPPDWPA